MPGRRVNLYGVNFELAEGWLDATSYVFRGTSGPLRSVCFAEEPVSGDAVEPWLLEAARALAGLPSARVSRTHRVKIPEFDARGFEVEFGEAEPLAHFALVAVPREADTLTITAKGGSGYQQPFRALVESLSRRQAPRAPRLPIFDLSFDPGVKLRVPRSFAFTSREGRFSANWVERAMPFGEPEWSSLVGLPADAVVTTLQASESRVKGRPTKTRGLDPLVFEERRVSAVAHAGGQRIELFFAEARAEVRERHLCLGFVERGNIARSFASFYGFLGSMTEEG